MKSLRKLNQWVCWRAETRNGKTTKVPYQPNGKHARVDDPSTWSSFEAVQNARKKFDGIGFVLSENDPYVAIDLDKCLSDPQRKTVAERIIASIDSYTEVSPSGNGVRIILRGKLPDWSRNRRDWIEVYDHSRYVTVTGNLIGNRNTIHERQEALEKFCREFLCDERNKKTANSKQATPQQVRVDSTDPVVAADAINEEEQRIINALLAKETTRKLFYGQISEGKSPSEGDFALCCAIARHTKDPVRIDRIFRVSGRYRDKWDEKHGAQTYGELTIANVLKAISTQPSTTHTARKEGDVKTNLACIYELLHNSQEWQGVVGYNEFAERVEAVQPPPWDGATIGPWTDLHDFCARKWIEQRIDKKVPIETVHQAIRILADRNRFHPVRNYLETLRWDGVPRLNTWLHAYLGCDDTNYTRAVGSRWLISAVARVFKPGCKVDHVLVVEGKQGIGKSAALEALFHPWFTDRIEQFDVKDAAMQVHGVWCVEIAELSAMRRTDIEQIKAFITCQVDRFRPPYGRNLVELPRQCVFAATTNQDTYLHDETGNRRFWPVRATRVQLDALRSDRDQLWAEAVTRFRAGEPWWIDSQELALETVAQQEERLARDPWEPIILEWVEDPRERAGEIDLQPFDSEPGDVTISDILCHALGRRKDQWTQIDANRVARVLRAHGWVRYRARDGETRCWRYRKP